MKRIVVVGTSGSGKTTLARKLAERCGCPHVELDALHWEPGWQEAPPDVFRERLIAALAGDAWVADGNYQKVRDLIWPRADTLLWLDYPLTVVLCRIFRRTVSRIFTREMLWGTNQEHLGALFRRDSILLWVLRTYRRRQREYRVLFEGAPYPHLTMIRLRSPRETDRWLAALTRPDYR